jgi:hypothetical protein
MAQRRPDFGTVGRLAWVVLLAGIAVLAILVQLDREARRTPWLASWVPVPFRGFAAEVLVRNEVGAGDPKAVLRDAVSLLARRPVPASHLSYLAQAEIRAGNQERGSQAIYLAAQREWRNAFAQQVIAQVALANGEPKIAAQRLYALWAITEGNAGNDAQLNQLTQAVLTEPDAQAEFGREIGGAVRWNRRFFKWGVEALPEQAFVTTIAHAQVAHASFECGRLGDYARALYIAGKVDMAAMAWKGSCGIGQASGEQDFRFHAIEGTAGSGPFDWVYQDTGVIDLQFLQSDDGRETWLQFANSDPVRRVVAFRFTRLAAGKHMALLDAVMNHALVSAADARISMRIDCVDANGDMTFATQLPASAEEVAFSVPAGCPAQRLTLIVQRGEGRIKAVYVR